MRKRVGMGWILGLTAVMVVLLWGWGRRETVPPVEVETTQVTRGTMEQCVEGTGLLTQAGMYTLASAWSGQIADVLVRPGMQVKKGQPVLRMDTMALEASYVAAIQADAQWSERLAPKTDGWIDPSMASWAEAWYALERERDTKQTALLAQQLTQGTLRAGRDGVVLQVLCGAGDAAAPGMPLAVLASNQREVKLIVGERDALTITEGMQARLLRDEQVIATALVRQVGLPTQQASGVSGAEITLVPQKALSLPTGTHVDVQIIRATKAATLLVPLEALDETEHRVWQVVDGRAWHMPVQTDLRNERFVAVSGVADGAFLVINPPHTLQEGQRVKGVAP
ncbi:MAG: biotin/lipoyl-binding protein [Clostridia bacterium]